MRIRNAAVAAATLCVVMAATAADAAVRTSHSGWFWGSPQPQGADLAAIDFNGSTGYAVGAFGTVLRTTDGGAGWTGLAAGTTADLTELRVLGPDSLVVGGECTLRRSDDGGQTFRRLAFTAREVGCSATLAGVHFPLPAVGYLMLSDGTVLITPDGGATFAQRTAIPGTQTTGGSATPTDLWFTSPARGFASTSGGRLYRTVDGGGSWTLAASIPTALDGIAFANASVGYAVGGPGLNLLRTEDGGNSWTPRPLAGAPAANLRSIRCGTPDNCLLAVEDGGQLLRTTDGGASATSVSPSSRKLAAVAFASATRAVAVGEGGATVVSTTGGETFEGVGGGLAGLYGGLSATSASLVYAFGADGALARTTDGGSNWSAINVSTNEDVRSVSFVSAQRGYAVDAAGTVRRTDNGGSSWRILDTGTAAEGLEVLANGADRVLLVTRSGLRRSTDGGGSFSAVRSKALRGLAQPTLDQAGGAIVAWRSGTARVAASANGGQTWKRIPLPRRKDARALDFVGARTGYVTVRGGRVYFTASAGRRWRELLSLGTSFVGDLAFASRSRGWIEAFGTEDAGEGVLLRTTDGGASWRPQLISRAAFTAIASGAGNAGNAGFALVDGHELLATASGGDQGLTSKLTLRASVRRITRRRNVTVSGKLSPAKASERVRVSMLTGGRWRSQRVRVASNGAFATTWRVARTARFVAQWAGDESRNGTGTRAITVSRARQRR